MKALPAASSRPRARVSAADEPLLLLHWAFRAIVAEPDARLAKLGLTRVHHRILFFVARAPNLRVIDLAATLGVSKQALHGPLQQLLRKKLLQSRPGPQDLRERQLSLSATGRSLERRLSGEQRRAFRIAFQSAGPRAVRGWRAVMRELGKSLAGGQPATAQR
jgi:DNA-binding MarR family transcriptional regulator